MKDKFALPLTDQIMLQGWSSTFIKLQTELKFKFLELVSGVDLAKISIKQNNVVKVYSGDDLSMATGHNLYVNVWVSPTIGVPKRNCVKNVDIGLTAHGLPSRK